MLKVKNISFTYPSLAKPTLNNINLNIDQNEIVSLVGPSGSGKSTLLKLVSGLLDADNGNIFLNNERVIGPSEQLVAGHPKIKIIHQDFKLMPHHSVIDNIEMHLRNLIDKSKFRRINEMLKLCKLEKLKDKKPYELSGGEKQRLAIAKTLADEPLLLLMDEPFTALDNILKNEIIDDIFEIVMKSGISTLFVTHDTKDALSYSQRVLVMKNGKIVSNDTPEQTYTNPKNRFIAELFGNSNIVNASFSKFLGLNLISDSDLLIRYEDIHEIPNGFEVKVLESRYMGFGYENKIEVASQVILKMWTNEKPDSSIRVKIIKYWEL